MDLSNSDFSPAESEQYYSEIQAQGVQDQSAVQESQEIVEEQAQVAENHPPVQHQAVESFNGSLFRNPDGFLGLSRLSIGLLILLVLIVLVLVGMKMGYVPNLFNKSSGTDAVKVV